MRARHLLAVSVWLVVLLGCAIIVSRATVAVDITGFLPRDPTPAQRLLAEQLRNGVVARLILVGIEGDDAPHLARISADMTARLRTQPEFASVDNGQLAGLEKDRDLLWRSRYLLSPAVVPGHFSESALRAALQDDLQLLGSPASQMVERTLANDPTGEFLRLLEGMTGRGHPDLQEGVWFSSDGSRALMVLQTHAQGYDGVAQRAVLSRIQAAFSAARQESGSTAARLLMTGPAVFSIETHDIIEHDAMRYSLIAIALVAGLLLALYRSPRMLIIGLLPLATGALVGVAAVALAFDGVVHGVTLGFGPTLIGEGADYAIYLFTQMTVRMPAEDALKRIWPTLRVGVVTSVLGFGALLWSGFPGLAQLGLFSVAGLLAAVLVTRYVLPGWVPRGYAMDAAGVLAPVLETALDRMRVLRWVLIAGTAAAAGFLALRPGAVWNDGLESLSPVPEQARRLDQRLRADMGAPDVRYLAVISAADRDEALAFSERAAEALAPLVAGGALQGYESPSEYLPSLQTQMARRAALPGPEMLRAGLHRAASGLPFQDGLFEPFLKDVETARGQPALDAAALHGTRLGLKTESLLMPHEAGWNAVLPLSGVTDAAAIAAALAAAVPGHAVFMDLRRESDDLFAAYRREIEHYALGGMVLIALFLAAVLRSARRVARVLLPLAAALVLTSAVLLIMSGPFSIFHLIGLLLVVAVGSNYALFFDGQSLAAEGRSRVLASLVFANLATVMGFGILAFSKVPVLHAIGATVGLGALLSLVCSAVLAAGPTAAMTARAA